MIYLVFLQQENNGSILGPGNLNRIRFICFHHRFLHGYTNNILVRLSCTLLYWSGIRTKYMQDKPNIDCLCVATLALGHL
jgi:hypothetical protein